MDFRDTISKRDILSLMNLYGWRWTSNLTISVLYMCYDKHTIAHITHHVKQWRAIIPQRYVGKSYA